jgi:hypothetical protein
MSNSEMVIDRVVDRRERSKAQENLRSMLAFEKTVTKPMTTVVFSNRTMVSHTNVEMLESLIQRYARMGIKVVNRFTNEGKDSEIK